MVLEASSKLALSRPHGLSVAAGDYHCEESRAMLIQMQHELIACTHVVGAQETDVSHLQSLNAQLRVQLKEATDTLAVQKSEPQLSHREMETALAAANDQRQHADALCRHLQQKVDDVLKDSSNIHKSHDNQLQARLSELEAQLAATIARESVNSKMSELENTLTLSQRSVQSHEREASGLHQSIGTLQTDLEDSEKLCESQKRELMILQTTITALQQRVTTCETVRSALEKKSSILESNTTNLQAQLDKSEDCCNVQHERMSAFALNNSRLEQEVAELKQSRGLVQKSLDHILQQVKQHAAREIADASSNKTLGAKVDAIELSIKQLQTQSRIQIQAKDTQVSELDATVASLHLTLSNVLGGEPRDTPDQVHSTTHLSCQSPMFKGNCAQCMQAVFSSQHRMKSDSGYLHIECVPTFKADRLGQFVHQTLAASHSNPPALESVDVQASTTHHSCQSPMFKGNCAQCMQAVFSSQHRMKSESGYLHEECVSAFKADRLGQFVHQTPVFSPTICQSPIAPRTKLN